MAETSRNSDTTLYTALSDIEEDADLLQKSQPSKRRPDQRLSLRERIHVLLQPRRPSFATMCIVVALLSTNLLTWEATRRSMPVTVAVSKDCPGNVAEPPKTARVLRELDLSATHPVKFDSTFWNYGSPYRGRPGPETDDVWENQLGSGFGAIMISKDEAPQLGITPDHLYWDGKDDQEGLEGYPVHVEAFHQLHCLNLIRMSTFYNADYYKAKKKLAFSHPEHEVIQHVDHCIDNLRQRTMCTADVGVIPFYWVNETGRIGTDPDFQQAHMCRNYSKLRDWMKDHMLPEIPRDKVLLPRPGAYVKDHVT